MATLITGGAGFIGGAVAERLLADGERVVALDNFDPYYDPQVKRERAARIEKHPRGTLTECDVRDAERLAAVVRDEGIRRIAHLAALAGVRESVEKAPLYVAVNTLGTVHALEAARAHGVESFVLGSTSSVYGENDRVPFREDDAADRPLASYPASKRAAEIVAHTYTNLFGLPVTALRFFNVYGPSGRPDMMPLRLMRAIPAGEPIPVFAGGELRRDWTYIDDVVDGVVSALERPLGYEVLNIGCGEPIALNAFIDTIEALVGREAIRVDTPRPASDPTVTYCDNTRARRLLGFDPVVDVREGLARTWAWYCEEAGP